MEEIKEKPETADEKLEKIDYEALNLYYTILEQKEQTSKDEEFDDVIDITKYNQLALAKGMRRVASC